jgi:hypothetical protein
MWIKKETTKGGAAILKKKLTINWVDCWDNIEQERIQA